MTLKLELLGLRKTNLHKIATESGTRSVNVHDFIKTIENQTIEYIFIERAPCNRAWVIHTILLPKVK